MRDIGVGAKDSERNAFAVGRGRLNVAVVYGAFAVIAAITFGTLSYHPF